MATIYFEAQTDPDALAATIAVLGFGSRAMRAPRTCRTAARRRVGLRQMNSRIEAEEPAEGLRRRSVRRDIIMCLYDTYAPSTRRTSRRTSAATC